MKPRHDLSAPDYPYRTQRARYLRLKAAGVCTACGARKATRGQCCEDCGQRQREASDRIRALAIECGICINCRKRAARNGRRTCARCGRDQYAKNHAREQAAALARPCKKCGGKKDKVRLSALCKRCSDAVPTKRERLHAILTAGLCQWCRRPRGEDGTTAYCRPCADEHSRRTYAAWLAKHGRTA